MKLNKNQKLAIEIIDENLLVNAGAGTGKTMVLVERYLNILENGKLEKGKEIESIVAITFTKKAAQEMIERIREKLREKYTEDEKWRSLYRDIGKSNISTIHSFCSRILRENPIAANIDPMFEILEDIEAEKILKSSIMDILSNKIESELDLYKLYSELEASTISSLIDDFYYLYNNIRNTGEDLEKLKNKYMKNIKQLDMDLNDLDEIIKLVNYLMESLRSNAKINNLLNEELWIGFSKGDYEKKDLKDILNLILKNLGTSKPYAEAIEKLKNTINKVFKSFEMENIKLYKLIMDIIIEIDLSYSKKKRELSVLDYDDLQLKVLSLLDNKDIKREYQNKYRYIMIDEFQDINKIQKDIFYKLSSKKEDLDRNNLFVVGDPKQSIYGFRGSDLNVFYQVLEDIRELKDENIITLDDNYRTSSNIMKFINNIFTNLMGERYNKLKSNIESKKNISIEVLESDELEIPKDISPAEYSRSFEANLISTRIRDLVDSGKYNYGDIALLFRSTKRDYIYEESFKKYNIPYYNTGGRGYFQRQEILDIINAFKAVVSPKDLISNIGFLRSPMIGLSDIQIYNIMREDGSIYEKLKSKLLKSKSGEEEIFKIFKIYEYLYDYKNYHTNSDLIEEILNITDYRELLLLKNESRQSIANLDKFIQLIKDFEFMRKDESIDILEYIEELKNRDESQAKVESERENVVKIMTIHKSKGLEYPVIIIPEMSSGSFTDNSKINFHKDIGIGLKLRDSSGIYDEIKELQKVEEYEEDKRILYVAMTRAEELLILGMQGANRGFKKMLNKYIEDEEVKKIQRIISNDGENLQVKKIKEEYFLENSIIKKPGNIFEDKNFSNQIIDKFSITQFLTFKECERKYFFKYYKKLDKMENLLKSEDGEELILDSNELEINKNSEMDPFTKGNIVHEFTELYEPGMDHIKLLSDIAYKYNVDYIREKFELEIYINNFLEQYSDSYDKVYKEKNFMLKLNNGIFTGAIDRINIEKNYLEIIDYKTNILFDKEHLLEIYSPQLQFYSYVVKVILNKKVDKAKLVFLKTGEVLEVDISDSKIEKLIDELVSFVNFVQNNHNRIDYQCKTNCDKKCPYDTICKRE